MTSERFWSDKLEIGSGSNPTEGYVHVDVDPSAKDVDLVGDVRSIFVPQDSEREYPDLAVLTPKSSDEPLLLFQVIRMQHFVEHVHWYNQPAMWRWLYQLLAHGGYVEIVTPDLEYVVKTYVHNKKRWWHRGFKKKGPKYPPGEHPELVKDTNVDLSRWVVFKLYSGGSFNKGSGTHDYHVGLYDKTRLDADLRAVGLVPSIRRVQGNLVGKAVKRQVKEEDYFKGEVNSEELMR